MSWFSPWGRRARQDLSGRSHGTFHVAAAQGQTLELTRPQWRPGERLGFLPGDLAEKVNPYLRPLYDALHDMMPQPKVASMMEVGSIEVAPLAFMRGRTLNDAFIILWKPEHHTGTDEDVSDAHGVLAHAWW